MTMKLRMGWRLDESSSLILLEASQHANWMAVVILGRMRGGLSGNLGS